MKNWVEKDFFGWIKVKFTFFTVKKVAGRNFTKFKKPRLQKSANFMPSGTILKVVQKSLIYTFVMKYYSFFVGFYITFAFFNETYSGTFLFNMSTWWGMIGRHNSK